MSQVVLDCSKKKHMVRPGLLSSSSSEQPSDSNEPKYKGVRKRKWGKWVSEIRLPNSRERIWLGSYDTPEKAARAFDAALYCLRGRGAKFNFPDNPPDIVGGQSLNPQEIQVAAARFANEYPTRSTSGSLDPSIKGESSSQHAIENNYTSSSSDGAVQVDSDTAIDWSFLNLLDSNESTASDFGLYSGLDNMGGDYYPPPPPPIIDNNDDDDNGDEAYSQQSFLWSF